MKKRFKLLGMALLTGTAGLIFSCGTGGETVSVNEENSIGTASITVGVKFPENISPQYIDNDVRCVEVSYTRDGTFKSLVLTPDNPVGTIEDIIPGRAMIHVMATDTYSQDNDGTYCEGNVLDSVNVLADIKEGTNRLVTTLISPAKWLLVDESDNPKPIVFNKIKQDALEKLESFNVVSTESEISFQSLDFRKPSGISTYKVAFIGNDFYVDNDNGEDYGCATPEQCITEGLYFNQFTGPDSSKNAFETDSVRLSPVQIGNDTYERKFFIFGVRPMYDSMMYDDMEKFSEFKAIQSDNTDVINDFESRFDYTKVVDATHMEGTILEIVEKGKRIDKVCSLDKEGTNLIDCPVNMPDNDMFGDFDGNRPPVPASITIRPNSISTQAIDDNDCYKDVSVIESVGIDYLNSPYVNCDDNDPYRCDYNMDGMIDDNDDINGDGEVNRNDNYYIIQRTITDADICVYPFRAKAEKIPETEALLLIQ